MLKFGPATKTSTRRSVAAAGHDFTLRDAAKLALKYPPVHFSGVQAQSISVGFHHAIERSGYTLHACAILPEHVHVVLSRCRYDAEIAVGQLKGEATKQLLGDGLHPLMPLFSGGASPRVFPSPWARSCWNVFLNTPADILRAIRYVENNPLKEVKPPQRWSFVTPFIT